MSLHTEITKQCREIEAQGCKPTAILLNLDTKVRLIETIPENRKSWFRPSPIASTDADKYRGLPIVLDWTMTTGEVKVA